MKNILFVTLLTASTAFGAADMRVCGTQETELAERIASCAQFNDSTKTSTKGFTWKLVTRLYSTKSEQSYEVWQDTTSGKLWGDRFDIEVNHNDYYGLYNRYYAVKLEGAPMKGTVKEETACQNKEWQLFNGKIAEKNFHLPSPAEYQLANEHGIREIVPHMPTKPNNGLRYWTTNMKPDIGGVPYGTYFDTKNGLFGGSGMGTFNSVRCVTRN